MAKHKWSSYVGDLYTLKEMGYDIHIFTAWHVRVSKVTRDFYLDVYPTTRTYIKKTDNGYSPWIGKKYKNLIHLVETELR